MAARTLSQWLTEYSKTHTHPVNKSIHNVCVPLIMLSTLGMIRSIPVPWELPLLGWDFVFLAACWMFYLSLDRIVALFMVILSSMMVFINMQIETTGHLLEISIAIFVLNWIGQFIGHKIEGKKPSFFQDLVFLLIGPLWVFAPAYKRFVKF